MRVVGYLVLGWYLSKGVPRSLAGRGQSKVKVLILVRAYSQHGCGESMR